MRRFLLAALLTIVVVFGGAAGAQARTRLDARVDALTRAQLLHGNAVTLVDPVRQRRARVLADLRHVAAAGWGLSQLLVFWWFWRSGAAARVRDVMRRRTRSRTLVRLVFGAVLGVLTTVAAFPFAVMSYRVSFSGGLIDETFVPWFTGYLVRIGIDALLGAVIVAGVLWLVDRSRLWYVAVIGIIYGGALAAIVVEPLLGFGVPVKTTPRTVAALGARVTAAAGVPGTPVVVTAASHRTSAMSVRTVGVGATARIVLADVALDHLTPPEVAVAIARGAVHARDNDLLRETMFGATLFVLSCALAVLLSDRVGFRRDDDALSRLALVATFLSVVLIVTYPIYNGYARNVGQRDDAAVVAVDGDRAAIVRAMVRFADVDLIPLCDRRSVRWYFADRPPLGNRIAAINGTAPPCPLGLSTSGG